MLSSISLWQDSSSKTDLPEDLESQQEGQWMTLPCNRSSWFCCWGSWSFLGNTWQDVSSRVAQADPCLQSLQSLQSCSFTLLWDHWRSQSALQYLLIRSREDWQPVFGLHIHIYILIHIPVESTAGAQRLPKDVCIFAHCRTVGNNFFNSGIC